MPARTLSLTFDGYWIDENLALVPNEPGIFVVYECSCNPQDDRISLLKMIYIGEATDVNKRIANHEKWPEWRLFCGPSNELCFSFAPVTGSDRARGEAALICRHKPPANDEYKYNFPFDETSIHLSGKASMLLTHFTLQRKD